MFSKYHYLDSSLHRGSVCYTSYINNNPVAFLAYIHQPNAYRKNIKRITRLVVLPDYQGIGIGNRTLDAVAESIKRKENVCHVTTSTPALLHPMSNSKKWKCLHFGRYGNHTVIKQRGSAKRITTSWEYIGEK